MIKINGYLYYYEKFWRWTLLSAFNHFCNITNNYNENSTVLYSHLLTPKYLLSKLYNKLLVWWTFPYSKKFG